MVDRKVNRRRILQLSGLATASALSGCASVVRQSDSESEQTTAGAPQTQTPAQTTETTGTADEQETPQQRPAQISEPQFDVPGEPLPEDTQQPRYPTLGTADTTLTVYGNWKCPYTQEFVRQQLGDLVEEFVVPGDVSIEYRTVAYQNGEPNLGEDAPRASEAGLAVWDIDPSSFWTYFAYVFANQPQERFEWATTDTLVRFAERADVAGIDQIRRAIRSRTYVQSVQQSADRADEIGISTVPRVAYDGEVTAPTVDPAATRDQFERAANGEFATDDENENESATSDDD